MSGQELDHIEADHNSRFANMHGSSSCDNQDLARKTALNLTDQNGALIHDPASVNQAQNTMNNYLLNKLANDPANHVTGSDLVKGYAGKTKGELINWLSNKAAN